MAARERFLSYGRAKVESVWTDLISICYNSTKLMLQYRGFCVYLKEQHKIWLATGERCVYLELSMANRRGLFGTFKR